MKNYIRTKSICGDTFYVSQCPTEDGFKPVVCHSCDEDSFLDLNKHLLNNWQIIQILEVRRTMIHPDSKLEIPVTGVVYLIGIPEP